MVKDCSSTSCSFFIVCVYVYTSHNKEIYIYIYIKMYIEKNLARISQTMRFDYYFSKY